MKLVSTTEMQQVEREAEANGLTYEMMMEHAGLGLAGHIAAEYGDQKDGGIFGLVGSDMSKANSGSVFLNVTT